ncbi:MmgE/PrpD family protein [Mycolicibacterium goodii]
MAHHLSAARALISGHGACSVPGSGVVASPSGAATANAYLMHAQLTDDSYRVAAHPGLAVIPVAVAIAEDVWKNCHLSGDRFLRSVVAGYECAGALADRLLPTVSHRGWRVTSVIAPLAAAVTAAYLLSFDDATAISAIGLAAATAGGPLSVVATGGDGWRLQPALAVQSGIAAMLAAGAGLRSGTDSMGTEHGYLSHFGARDPRPTANRRPAVHDVTFKRYPVAMYGQSIFDALCTLDRITGEISRLRISLHPFAAQYGNQSQNSAGSISDVRSIAVAGLQSFHPGLTLPHSADRRWIEIDADPEMHPLNATLELTLADASHYATAGNGDTSHWGATDFTHRCGEHLGPRGRDIAALALALPAGAGLADLLHRWQKEAVIVG